MEPDLWGGDPLVWRQRERDESGSAEKAANQVLLLLLQRAHLCGDVPPTEKGRWASHRQMPLFPSSLLHPLSLVPPIGRS